LSYGSQTLVNDAYGPLIGKPSDKKALWLGRFFMILIMAASMIVVYSSDSLMGIAVMLTGIFGSTALIGWAQWWWWRINFKSWVTANIAGPVVYFAIHFICSRVDWWQQQSMKAESIEQQMQMYQAIIAMVITTILWMLVAIFTKPEDMELLKNFYRKSHPQGFWKPVRLAIEAEDGRQISSPKFLISAGFIVAIIGASWLILSILSLSVLFVGKWFSAAAYGTPAIVLGVIFKYAFVWHIDRMAKAAPIDKAVSCQKLDRNL